MTALTNDLTLWITAFDLPAMAGLFWLIWRTRQDSEHGRRVLRDLVQKSHNQMSEALSSYKLEVAKTYAALSDVKELELRLVSHLLRIEAKLDTTAMKTEALRAEKNNHKEIQR